jgi:hypothetical protein
MPDNINMTKKLILTSCPCCSLPMRTSAMSCVVCGVKIEADFIKSNLDSLSLDDQKFLEQFLLAGFSIKKLEQTSPLGYAAIRSRLDRLIENFKSIKQMDVQKKQILEELRKGEISVEQAKEKLGKL